VGKNESDHTQRKSSGLFVVPKVPKAAPAKLVTYSATGQVLIQSEFSDQLEELTTAYIAEYTPRGIAEFTLVRDLATAQCRCDYTERLLEQHGVSGNEKMLASLTRFQTSNRGMFKRSLKMLKQIQKERAKEIARKPRLVKPKITGGC
jgi:hypothetical protein